MPTNKTDRYSMMPPLVDELKGDELMVVSRQGSPKTTNNAETNTVRDFITGELAKVPVTSVVSFGGGIAGTGNPNDPLKLDPAWLDTQLLKNNSNVYITSVGDHNVRALPISQKHLFKTNVLDCGLNTSQVRQFPACGVDPTGELRILMPGINSTVTAAYGRWSVDRDLKSEQLIQRSIRPTPPMSVDGILVGRRYNILEVFANTHTAALGLVYFEDTNEQHIYYFPLKDGSLRRESFGYGYSIAKVNSVMGRKILNGSAAIANTTAGTHLFVLPNPTASNVAVDIEVYSVAIMSDTVSLTQRTGWTTNSYVGLLTAQPHFRVFDRFAGVATDKCALVIGAEHTAKLTVDSGHRTHGLSVIQDPQNRDLLYLYFRGYALITNTASGNTAKYNYDIGYRVNITKTTVSATALPSYLGAKPVVSGDRQFQNIRHTIINHPNNPNSELLKILNDGSVVAGLVSVNNAEPMAIHPSKSKVLAYRETDLAKNIADGLIQPSIKMDFRPRYGAEIPTRFKLYIASKIEYVLGNGGRGVIEPQILDVSGLTTGAVQPIRIPSLPYVKDRFRGLEAYPVHLYIQHTGTTGVLLTSATNIPEAPNSAYIASIWFLTDGVNTVLTHQAFSRLNRHRLSYSPRGMAVPVSYGFAGQPPAQFWLTKETQGLVGNDKPRVFFLRTNGIFSVPPNHRAMIYVVGGGGGGGGSIHNYSSSWYAAPRDGDPGGDTTWSLSANFQSNVVICGGGKGGIGANWGNGTSFSVGYPGAGGVNVSNLTDPRIISFVDRPGIQPPRYSRWDRQPGGNSVHPDMPFTRCGRGGWGAWGSGDEGHSFGGGGGSGAGCIIELINPDKDDLDFHFTIGAAGAGRILPTAYTNGNRGWDGAPGFIVVELFPL